MASQHSLSAAQRAPTWPLVLATFALVLLPASARVLRPEVSRWYLASAQDWLVDARYFARQASQAGPDAAKSLRAKSRQAVGRAEKLLEQSVPWAGKTPEYYKTRALIRRAQGDVGAELADLQTAAEKERGGNQWRRWSDLGGAEFQREMFGPAIEHAHLAVTKAGSQSLSGQHAPLLNQLAYYSAVAGQRLEQALQEVDTAIELYERIPSSAEVEFAIMQFRDTRGFILLGLGRKEEAREEFDKIFDEDVDKSVFERWFESRQKYLSEYKKLNIDIRDFAPQRQQVLHSAAVLLNHRMMTLDPEKEAEEIAKIQKRILAYGYRPGPALY